MTEEVIIYVDGESASCMGELNDHPKVYYFVPKRDMQFVDIVVSSSQGEKKCLNVNIVMQSLSLKGL